MQFGQLLTHLDTTQQMINNSLKDNNTLLTQVGSSQYVLFNNAGVWKKFGHINVQLVCDLLQS